MISIITVNWNSYDFLNLLIESLERYASVPYELIIIDNSSNQEKITKDKLYWHPQKENIGHGAGLNLGVTKCQFPYIMFLDVDVHFINFGWESMFMNEMSNCDVVGAKGSESKPIRPACMFMKKEFSNYDWAPTPGYKGHRITPDGYDVAIKAYHQMIKDEVKIKFMENAINPYPTLTGEVWGLNKTPLIYHHWHGSHLKERQIDFPENDLINQKEKLFSNIPWRLP